ncbi:DUF3375 domain-containing protein [Nakamurella sp. A5-74]|uniref:DUF3375 domain-containing protein n=1 Tax=Nakamurella sp. A5-74 TaxID=3158264 RepID=A0AAU8DRP0_9ACTN
MEHDRIASLRTHSAAWRLLRADSAPLVLSVLGVAFVVDNARSLPETELMARLDDQLHALNQDAASPAYPRSAHEYLDTWCDTEHGWLRKYYPEKSDEPHYDATSDLEKAYAWVVGLEARSFVGTASRLQTVIELLRQMVHGASVDPAGRIAALTDRRAEIDAELARAEAGLDPPLDRTALADRYQHFTATARDLLADFREVEENFRALDRATRERIAGWEGSKGDLLDELLGDRNSIAASDQGRSFQAFYEFLLSRSSQEELTELLDKLTELDQISVDRSVRHVHYGWMDAAERTQQTVRTLSEQLRRFLDDKVWLENRRVMDLLRSIERSALVLREQPRPAVETELDAVAPRINLALSRPLYAPSMTASFADTQVLASTSVVDPTVLFDQFHVDSAELAGLTRAALRRRDQVSLSQLLHDHPPEQGLAEILGYLGLDEDDFEVVGDPSAPPSAVPIVDDAGNDRVVGVPEVTFVRRRAVRGAHP